MKQLLIIGNLGADAQYRVAADGTQFSAFNVAVSTNTGTIWFGVLLRYREKLHPYLVKGQKVFVQGNPSFKVYQDRPDITINADLVELLGSASATEPQP